MPAQNDYASKLYHCQKIFRMKFVSYDKATKVLQSSKEPFHLPAPAVAMQCPAILGLAPVASIGRNHLCIGDVHALFRSKSG